MLTGSILKINRFVKKIKSFEVKEYNLKGITVACLYYLNNYEYLTSKNLVSLCSEDKATISRALGELEKKEYIYFEDNLKKRYNSKIYLTENGIKVAAFIKKRVDSIFQICGKNLSDDERINFYNTLIKITNNLEKYVDEEVY